MFQTPALSAPAAGASFEQTLIERRELREHDVLIDIHFCGICHSDIHQVKDEWGGSIFPMVPGHEIAGIVAAVGDGVQGVAVGDRVGVGCLVDSCGECAHCLAGEEQHCIAPAVPTYNGIDYDGEPTYGGYSRQIVVRDRFVVHIPDEVDLAHAAPLLCAGITTYAPLKRWGVGEGTRLLVVGLGGLGHLAVKIGVAMGAEVTVLSQTLAKEHDGLRFGARRYIASSDADALAELNGHFDLILNTVSGELDINQILGLLAVDGTLVTVGAPPRPLEVAAFALIVGRRSLAGSVIGGLAATQEMLDFCAEHGVMPEIEIIGASDVADAYDRVERSSVRYRFVMDVATISPSGMAGVGASEDAEAGNG